MVQAEQAGRSPAALAEVGPNSLMALTVLAVVAVVARLLEPEEMQETTAVALVVLVEKSNHLETRRPELS
jgi:ABC-type enterobactin transport system permease subunit